jgi:hypothetical protein
MQRLELELSNRKGFTLVLAALLIIVFLGTAAFAVDAGHANLNRAQVHAAADAAALAGIEKYSVTGDASSALAEARLYAGKFNADNSALTLLDADFALGHCSVPCSPGTFVAGSPDTVAKATIRDTTHYAFAPVFSVFGLNTPYHLTAATAIAVGSVAKKSVTRSGCVAPVVMPMSSLFKSLGETGTNTDTLTASDVAKLQSQTDTVILKVQNGSPTQIGPLGPGDFYQAEFPPRLRADGSTPGGQSNSASMFRSAFTCDDTLVQNIGVGDWLGAVNGVKANQTQDGATSAAGGSIPPAVTVEVVLTDVIGSPTAGTPPTPVSGCPCLHVAYVGAFTFTSFPSNKEIRGFFTALTPLAGGVLASDTLKSKPLGVISKVRLIF